jgi:hypothetical protein
MMKQLFVYILLILFTMGISFPASAQDPAAIVIKEVVKKVIVAIDLKIQRLQTKTIWLQNAQKVLENSMAKLKLDEITGWVQKQKDLYQEYFDELWKVKQTLSYYHRIKVLTRQQIALVRQYKGAWSTVQQDHHFTAREVLYMGQVYTGIIEASLHNLDQLALVIQSFRTQMSDAARLELINRAADAMQQNCNDLDNFTNQNIELSLARSRDKQDLAFVKQLYGIQ